MKITLQKENILNAVKAVKGIVNSRGVQPVLSSILFETISSDRIKLTTTDLNLSMSYTINAQVEKKGKAAIGAKVIEEIITKLPDKKDILLDCDSETKAIKISTEKIKYEITGLNADEFPNTFEVKKQDAEAEETTFEISTKDFNRAIKQTAFCALQNEAGSVLSGVCFTINENTLEMVATDGNRLARCRVPINSQGKQSVFICSYRTLTEISKLMSILPDKTVKFTIKGSKILFEFEDLIFNSSLINGNYPKYQQLIPETNEKIAVLNRDKFINSIDRISVVANERTNIMKFNFEASALEISTDNAEAGSAKASVEIDYNSDELLIAFNYKYVLEALRCITTDDIRVEMSTNLSATLVRPENSDDAKDQEDYLCLIMPVQVPRSETK